MICFMQLNMLASTALILTNPALLSRSRNPLIKHQIECKKRRVVFHGDAPLSLSCQLKTAKKAFANY